VSALAAIASEARVRQGEAAPYSVTRVTCADVEEQAASLREWDQVYEQISPGRFAGALHGMGFGGVRLFREATNQAVHEAGSPWSGLRAFGVPVRAEGTMRFCGECVDADSIVTVGAGEEVDFYAPREFEILGLVLDDRRLDAYARQVEHRDVGPALRRRVLRPGAERAGELRSLLGSMLQSIDVNPGALQHAPTQRVLEQAMFGAVVALASDDTAGTPPSGGASRQQIVDAAKAYMQSHIAEPITVADLCRELGVSRRTLQYAFAEVLGINPVAFLRAMRLNGVRRDLKRAPPGERVHDVAARWGFWHLGHFVTDYRRMFGELPSQTLGAPRRRM
jgi:AraC family ethanolamine operon transcriptional activator